jgi:hypothetical protein
MQITYTDGSEGTATVEAGKYGPAAGSVLVLRRGNPVAAEIVGAVPLRHLTVGVLLALGVSGDDAGKCVGRWQA